MPVSRKLKRRRERLDIKYTADTAIADSRHAYDLAKASFDQEVNTKKADAELAYELNAAKMKQKIRSEEIEIEVVERRKLIDVEEQEILRKDKELISTVRALAAAESFKVETLAQGRSAQKVLQAQAEAEKIKAIGCAEASAIEAIGKAEAERMRQKASVYKQYGDAAMMRLVLESLPKIAAEVAAPLSKTEEIVMVSGGAGTSGGRMTAEVTQLVSQLPPAVQALTGVDLSKTLSKTLGAETVR